MDIINKLEKLQDDILAFLEIHDNPYDTSSLNEKAERLKQLLGILKKTPLTPTKAPADMKASVGKGGNNDNSDVRWVQTRLNVNGASLKVDGDCGSKTQAAIGAFQKKVNESATQLIEPGDATYGYLGGKTTTDETPTDDNNTDNNTDNATPATTLKASVGKGGNNDEADVRWVQTQLNANGARLKVDGDCGPVTKGAIGAFQKQKQLPETQLIEPNDVTHQALEGKTPTDTTTDETPQPAAIKGSVGNGGNNDGDDVRWVQTRLNANGAQLKVDGDCGPVTKGAIGAFQKRKGLSETQLVEPHDASYKALEGSSSSGTGGGDTGTGGNNDNQTETPDDGNHTNTPVTNASIQASVGRGGTNQPEDVRTVQSLLKNNWDYNIDINGTVDDPTIQAIRQFQHRYAGMINSQDSRVDPNGTTWKYLVGELQPTMGKTDDGILGGAETEMEKQLADFTKAFSGITVTLKNGDTVTVRPPYHINLDAQRERAEAARRRYGVTSIASSLGYGGRSGKASVDQIRTFLQTCIDRDIAPDTTSQGLHEFLSECGIATDCSGLATQAANFLLAENDEGAPHGEISVLNTNTRSIQQHPEVGSPNQLQAGDMMVNNRREGTRTFHVRILIDIDRHDDVVEFTTVESTGSDNVGDGGDGVGQRRWKFPNKNSFDNLHLLVGNEWRVAGRSDQAYIYVRLRHIAHLEDN